MQQPELGTKLKQIRESKKLSQDALARLCNINIRTIQRIEIGKVVPRLYTLKILSDALEYDFNVVLTCKPIESIIASFPRRAVAFMIDQIVLCIPNYFIMLVAAIITPPDIFTQFLISFPFILIISALYFLLFWYSSEGATVGMMLLKIQIARLDGSKLSFFQSILRFIGFLVSILPFYFGLLWALFDKKNQGWHDKLAKTIVINK